MPQLEIAFTKRIAIKNNLSVAKSQLRDILEDNKEYKELEEKRAALNDRKKQILAVIAEEYPKLVSEIDDLKAEMRMQDETVSDVAVNQLVNGETLTMPDPDDETKEYVPIIKIKFHKADKINID